MQAGSPVGDVWPHGPRVVAARRMLGWSQRDLAARSLRAQRLIDRLERGEATSLRTWLSVKAAIEEAGVTFGAGGWVIGHGSIVKPKAWERDSRGSPARCDPPPVEGEEGSLPRPDLEEAGQNSGTVPGGGGFAAAPDPGPVEIVDEVRPSPGEPVAETPAGPDPRPQAPVARADVQIFANPVTEPECLAVAAAGEQPEGNAGSVADASGCDEPVPARAKLPALLTGPQRSPKAAPPPMPGGPEAIEAYRWLKARGHRIALAAGGYWHSGRDCELTPEEVVAWAAERRARMAGRAA